MTSLELLAKQCKDFADRNHLSLEEREQLTEIVHTAMNHALDTTVDAMRNTIVIHHLAGKEPN